MKLSMLSLLLAFIFVCQANPEAKAEKFNVKRGTNLSHWLSQSRKRGKERAEFITQKDIVFIAGHGFDHVRVPIDEEQMWDELGKRNPDAFRLLNNCIKWCSESGLKVIVDLHILRSHHFNAKEKPLWTDPDEQEKFYDLWREMSKELKKYPNSLVAYELMNEAVAENPEQWNILIKNAVAVIRKNEPERTIVIGSNRFQQVGTFDELKVPENDPNILLSFHFYEPFLLTHWGASWNYMKDYKGPVHYPGTILTQSEFDNLPEKMKEPAKRWVNLKFDKNWIRERWQEAIRKAQKMNLPLYCGEFGIISGTPEKDKFNWYQDMVDLFEEYQIGYANWDYKSGSFGLLNDKGVVNEEMLRIVSGN